jgi:hypothetical protein
MQHITDIIARYLHMPRTFEEIAEKFAELGSAWNPQQIELFLTLLPGAAQEGDQWRIVDSGKEQVILTAVEQALIDRPVAQIHKILRESPLLHDVETTAEEVLQIALRSGRYTSPNNKVLKRG